MHKIIYRNIDPADYEAIEELINQVFSLYQYVEDEKMLQYVKKFYLASCLVEHGFGKVAIKENRVIGVIMGNANGHKHRLKSVCYVIKMFFYALRIGTTGIKKITRQQGYGQIQQAYDNLIKGRKHLFDGTLTLFAVTSECRGLGIGKSLLQEIQKYYNQYSIKHIYLYTDDNCNYGFYEHMGFERMDTRIVEVMRSGKQEVLEVYLYDCRIV